MARDGESVTCACGKSLHYTNPKIRASMNGLVDRLGPDVRVLAGTRTWLVPRHYIALHGLKAIDLPSLARQLGFKEVTGGAA